MFPFQNTLSAIQLPAAFRSYWRKSRQIVVWCFCILALASCVEEEEFSDDPMGNFEALWRIMDEHYCFFDEKNIDWNEVHLRYRKQINSGMNDKQLFEVMCNMLSELRDGHVNLYTSFDMARYWSWYESYPPNYSDSLVNHYLGTHYKIAASIKYHILDDNIGYMRYESFMNDIGGGNLDQVFLELMPCRALIIDIRDNTGGNLTTAEKLAARFTNEERLVGYMQHQIGRGHNDFSSLEEQWLKPSNGIRWQKPVIVLINRQVFSAANEFVKYMRQCPNVTLVGDQTGGGAGLPFSSELPNGWGVRFSACPMYDVNKQSPETGIQPDYHVNLTSSDYMKHCDTIIEFARTLVK